MKTFKLGHAEIHGINLAEAVSYLSAAAQSGKLGYVVTPNSDHIVMLEHNEDLRQAYQEACLVVADGMPLVWASKLLGGPLPERVTGSELMPALCAEAAKKNLKVFLLGAGPGVADIAKIRLELLYPGLKVVGTHCPPLGFENRAEQVIAIKQQIEMCSPDLIFVGLGAPKQELWMHKHCQSFSKGIFLGIGASIDFCAGKLNRAPLWMQKAGLEWVYRLLKEPRRLAGRYLRDSWVLWIILRQFFRNRKLRGKGL